MIQIGTAVRRTTRHQEHITGAVVRIDHDEIGRLYYLVDWSYPGLDGTQYEYTSYARHFEIEEA